MDQLEPFKVFLLERLEFAPNSYEVYQGGQLIDRGYTSMNIKVRSSSKNTVSQDNIKVFIENNNLSSRLNDIFLPSTVVITRNPVFLSVV